MPLFGFWEIVKKSTQLLTGSRYSMSTIVGMSLVSAVLEGCVKPHSFSLLMTWNHLRGPNPDSDLAPLCVGLTALSHPSWVPNLLLDFPISLLFVLSLPTMFDFFVSHLQALLGLLSHYSLSCYCLFSKCANFVWTVVSALLSSAWWTCSPAKCTTHIVFYRP